MHARSALTAIGCRPDAADAERDQHHSSLSDNSRTNTFKLRVNIWYGDLQSIEDPQLCSLYSM